MSITHLPTGDEKFQAVQTMFDQIAPRYDLMNRLMTLGLDQSWRRNGLRAIGVNADDRVFDIACGTGDLVEMAKATGAEVYGVDFAHGMLRSARRRGIDAALIQGDAGRLPLPDGAATVVTCGFALRNFVDMGSAIREMGRILSPGGRLLVLEVHEPGNRLLRLGHGFYFQRVVPLLGALLSDRDAYAYLPKSVAYLPADDAFFKLFRDAGFENIRRKPLLFGAAQMITGSKA